MKKIIVTQRVVHDSITGEQETAWINDGLYF